MQEWALQTDVVLRATTAHGRAPVLTLINQSVSQRGASDSVTDISVLSNPADAQNVSCLGHCGKDICPKSSA